MQVGVIRACEADGPDDKKTLRDIRFQTGDFMDVAITTPRDRAREAEARRRPAAPPRNGRRDWGAAGRPRR